MTKLSDICKNITYNAKLKNYLTMGVGGNCECICFPTTIKEIVNLIKFCNETSKKYFILGNGSNVISTDKGFTGVIICLNKFSKYKIKKNILTAESGMNLFNLNTVCANNKLTGIEWSYGIPGTIGGAIFMNAGAYGGEISNHIKSITVLENGKIKKLNRKDLWFDYRDSSVKKNNQIVLKCEIELKFGETEQINKLCRDYYLKRKQTQPLVLKNSGSIFKKTQGQSAGKIIDNLGLKGVKIGKAEISNLHANFIVNLDNAKAQDVIDLIEYIKKEVQEKTGITLQQEVIIIGEK